MTTETKPKKDLNDEYVYKSEWSELFTNPQFIEELCEDILEPYIITKRWYGGKASALKYIELIDHFKIEDDNDLFYGLVLEVNFREAFVQNYFIPIALVTDQNFSQNDIITKIQLNETHGFLVDATLLESFRKQIFDKILEGAKTKYKGLEFRRGRGCKDSEYISSRFLGAEQSNTSIIFNDKYILKIFRRIFTDQNPDYEINKYLTDKGVFKNTPKYSGSITLRFSDKNVITLALMQRLVPNEGDAWEYFLAQLKDIFKKLSEIHPDVSKVKPVGMFDKIDTSIIPKEIMEYCPVSFFEDIDQLALRTAQMHVALGLERINTQFTPQVYSTDYSVWLKNRLIYQFENRVNLVENSLHKLEGMRLELAQEFLDRKKEIRKRLLDFDESKLKGERIRIHGDYHLGQVLVSDGDFYIIDFEGEPESTIRDRKVKQPPLKDVAGIFRSFNYSVYSTIFNNMEDFRYSQEELFHFAEVLYSYMVAVFLRRYVKYVQSHNLSIGYKKEIQFVLNYCLLEKAVYELGYELNSRPRWAVIPLKGISKIINS
ncbi:phosphotransferase [Aquimarina sp. MMG016]|uniref:phosphotransferase n=1 Tax=Aquimarina sp. MMG016 TaxID=2822690 RepID=UPI001B39FD46|nr:phosphotransferase [Aquimarina sp. MMG016]MBQ4819447.1 phosphotransferase [Aquimarina sp. MMG016]